MDRRSFLELLAAAGNAHAAAGQPDSPAIPSLRYPCRKIGRRIVVLGAGLAGLASAYNLTKKGYEVIVLEAQSRPGGRVLTVRDRFQNGGFAEMGAVRIFETHRHTQKYVAEFGLELVPYRGTGRRAFYMQGKRFLAPLPKEGWPLDGFHPSEATGSFSKVPAIPDVRPRKNRRRV